MTEPRQPSRRDFLAAAGTGLAGIAAGSMRVALREESPLDDQLLYVGTYTDAKRSDGIYLLRMDPRTGQLRAVGSVDAGPNPSFLALHRNGRLLYAVNEVEQGAVGAFAIAAETGALTRLNQMGITVHRSQAATIQENIALLASKSLPVLTVQGCCGGHSKDGGCAH